MQVSGIPENCTLVMNKNLSTPYNCAMRESNAKETLILFVFISVAF